MFIIFIAILIALCSSPALLLFCSNSKPADNSGTTSALIMLQSRLFYLLPSPFMGSTGAIEDVFLIKMRQRKRRHSVHIGLHACSTYGSGYNVEFDDSEVKS